VERRRALWRWEARDSAASLWVKNNTACSYNEHTNAVMQYLVHGKVQCMKREASDLRSDSFKPQFWT